MSLVLSIVGLVILGLLGLFLYIAYFVRKLGTPTKGAKIDNSVRPNEALVVIDVQEDFTRNTGKNAFDPSVRDAALDEINRMISAARKAGHDVVFVRNVFRDWPIIQLMKLVAGGIGTPGREELKFDRKLEIRDSSVFEKSIGDTFSSPDFENFLAKRDIGRLTLVGLDACHCVQLTAKGALSRGYEVEIREPAILTATPAKWPSLKQDLTRAGAAIA
ncbi:cysteine hydrolase [uncultured Roseibium sp.]|uniref:cysteine hydrolase family protein n=1 Tax=uncultured Roseibium sp. TaxID=1936171 RepID=UPI0026083390|nr:cysteine hydrolase [uncultured Roseibium sp.]